MSGHHHSHSGSEHSHGVSADANQRQLAIALGLILGFMAVEVAAGVIAHSLALLSDAAHMLTDAGAIALSLWAARLALRPARGAMTYGFRRAEILSAQANGITLLLLAVLIIFEAIRRLLAPPDVDAGLILAVAIVGIGVNVTATWVLARANRQSLNVEGSFQHILTDLYAFIGTAIAACVILATGFDRADPIASLFVAALMLRAAYFLLKASGRIFLEAAPEGINVEAVGQALAEQPGRGRGARPAHLGGHIRLPGALRPRARRGAGQLPRDPPRARPAPARPLPADPHHPPGRALPAEPGRAPERPPAQARRRRDGVDGMAGWSGRLGGVLRQRREHLADPAAHVGIGDQSRLRRRDRG